jgi:CMP-N-acetylneuraminic acid synthetase
LRPAHLATDAATTVSVVQHLVAECTIAEGFLLLLQATAPLRTLADLDGLCRRFEEDDADAIVSLVAIDEPRPEKLKRISGDYVFPYLENAYEGPRQSLPQPYALNGAFYLISLEAFLRDGSFLPRSTLAYVMPPERSHNLDTLTDWNILEAMVGAGHWAVEEYGR